MHFDPTTVTVAFKDELLIGKRIFNFLSQVKMSSLKEVEILEKWMNDYSKRGIPFIVTETIHPTKKLINTLWKEETVLTGVGGSKIIYEGGLREILTGEKKSENKK